jgi:hypothetical protein
MVLANLWALELRIPEWGEPLGENPPLSKKHEKIPWTGFEPVTYRLEECPKGFRGVYIFFYMFRYSLIFLMFGKIQALIYLYILICI